MAHLYDEDRGIARFFNVIDGEKRSARTNDWLDSINPATARTWAVIPAAGASDIDEAVSAAYRAFRGPWRKMPAMQRAGLLRKIGDLIATHADELALIETQDNGKLLSETSAGDLPAVTQMFHYWAGAADKLHGETVDISPASLNYIRREPIGVVGIVIPWNSPLSIFTAKVGAALAAGNTVVVKPAETASCSVLAVAQLFAKAGFPPGVVNVVAGLGTTAGDALAGHPDVGKITLTGSTATARAITRRSADAIKPLSFELGGKSANIVFADADLDAAAIGTTTNGGLYRRRRRILHRRLPNSASNRRSMTRWSRGSARLQSRSESATRWIRPPAWARSHWTDNSTRYAAISSLDAQRAARFCSVGAAAQVCSTTAHPSLRAISLSPRCLPA